jgi:hypothetical protein
LTKKITGALLILIALFMILRPQPNLFAAPTLQTSTPTPAPTEEPMEEGADMASAPAAADEAAVEPTIAELAARIDALQAQIDELAAAHAEMEASAAPAEVTTAVYLLDTAGLHELDVRLNEDGLIEPSDAGNVGRVARLLSSVAWPQALAGDAVHLTDLLKQLATALENDDAETAAPLATQVHDLGHDFSHATEEWVSAAALISDTHVAGQAFRVTSAVYLLDTAGLHDIDVRLNEEGVIQAADAGLVGRVARLRSAVDWPDDLSTGARGWVDVLLELAPALDNEDVEAAAPLATEAHDVGHEFSHEAEHWLG